MALSNCMTRCELETKKGVLSTKICHVKNVRTPPYDMLSCNFPLSPPGPTKPPDPKTTQEQNPDERFLRICLCALIFMFLIILAAVFLT